MKTAAIVLAAALSGAPQDLSNESQDIREYCAQGCVVMSQADWEELKQHIARLRLEAENAIRNSRGMCT
jgi:hypothetical protein